MILRTWERCKRAFPHEDIYVATDDERIATVCREASANVVMTSSACLTGTDRVAEAALQIPADTYINVQGDEPLFNPADIGLLCKQARTYSDDVINGYCDLNDAARFVSRTVPKVVLRPDGRLLYMSRAAIPHNKEGAFMGARRQVCAYAFPRQALKAFSEAGSKTPLEALEDIEILRFLELGWEVRMVEMSDVSIPVDVPADVLLVESAIKDSTL